MSFKIIKITETIIYFSSLMLPDFLLCAKETKVIITTAAL